ncbi:hypothetical protein [Pseudonocardia acaciae]|uniref:hypothetical protein n=1 Tax=Pseudonocardia acaciae TaxID=551276 RepID=UPI00048FBA05|nr:hypothetical protein [Pseudonocardia acaciae]
MSITLGALGLCLILAAVAVIWFRARLTAATADHGVAEDDVPVGWARRRAQEMHSAALVPPGDPRVAELARKVREDYKLGDATWDTLASDVQRELERDGEVGVETARFIVTSALADFRWELDFLENWNSVPAEERAETPIRSRLFRVMQSTPASPFSTPSGFHPLIHLAAALKMLTARPAPDLLETLEELLEYWFAYGESETSLRPHDAQLLETLVDCYRSTVALASHHDVPKFLTELAARDASPPDEFSLSSLAARAHTG